MLERFIACMREQMDRSGFGQKRTDEIVQRFMGLAERYRQDGHADAEVLAMTRAFNELVQERADKAKRAMSDLLKQLDRRDRFGEFNTNTAVFRANNENALPSRIAVSFIEDDPRSGGLSYSTYREVFRGQLWSIMADVLDKVGKGAFATQRGAAHLPNIVREIFGANTGDRVAKEVAIAWRKTADASVDLFNTAGGSLRKLTDWNLPQAMNAAKLTKAGEDDFVKFHLGALDWQKTSWPTGEPIRPAQREDFLKAVYLTLSTGGVNKIDPAAFRGQGRAIGAKLDEHRLLHYKDGDAWLDMHERYGDGNVFDVMVRHTDDMAHRSALVQVFGSNPEMGMQHVRALALAEAAKKGPAVIKATEGELKNVFDKLSIVAQRSNPMDPESVAGNLVVGTANMLTAAQLGSASFLAIPGDFMTTAIVRAANHMNPFAGVGTYLKALAFDRAHSGKIAAQSGFIFDEAVTSNYGMTRFGMLATSGPQITRRVADTTLRLSLLSGHTTAARWTAQAEFMGLMARSTGTTFDDLPFANVLQRYGIGAKEWDAFRTNVKPTNMASGADFLRPIDLLQSKLPNAQELYNAFQGMIFEESRKMVPEATMEGAVRLRDTTRPDTLPGALLHSFAMYKNFPISMMMTYGRLAMSNPDRSGRLATVAGLGVGMSLVGALGVQMREISRGRDPLPMDTANFWGKAFLSGGALGIWGDFLFQNINQYGKGPAETAAGPVVGFVGDSAQLAFGDTFKWVDKLGGLHQGRDFEMKTPAKAVEYAKRYLPGSSLWWARLALERQVWDRLSEVADPHAYRHQRQRINKQRKDFGNDYWYAPGDRQPERAPSFKGVIRQ